MTYSIIGILAILVLVIINQDVLWSKNVDVVPAHNAYRNFLFGVLAYYITDVLWGILDEVHLVSALYADTTVYFVAMTAAVLLWTQYVAAYLEKQGTFGTVLVTVGKLVFAFGVVIVIVNIFAPVLFWFDEDGAYHAEAARYATLGVQIVMFLLTSIYTFATMVKSGDAAQHRYQAIGWFGVAMVALIVIQVFYPLLPLYSMGYMIGSCLLHTFVVEDEKEEYRAKLVATLQRERQREIELGSARQLAYTDPLTGVKSKHAYVEAEAKLNQRISQGEMGDFGIAVFDLNGLKKINDTKGHEAGDLYIIEACNLICNCFKHSPVYRVGGDEFVVVLEGEDFERRIDLLDAFNRQVEQNIKTGNAVVSAGISDFNPSQDSSCWTIFDRADSKMYMRKNALKASSSESA